MKQEQWDELKRLHFKILERVSPASVSISHEQFSFLLAAEKALPKILAEREAAMRLRDDVRVYRQQLRVENVVDNPSGAACSACRSTGCAHCCDPINCGGLKQMREPTREEWLVALRLLAAFDKESKND